MSLNKEQFLNQFTRQALDERISLFVGAGTSADVGYPSWYNLFKPLAKELGTTLLPAISQALRGNPTVLSNIQ